MVGFEWARLILDQEKNESVAREITAIHCEGIPILVIPTNEELEMAVEATELFNQTQN